MSRSAALRLGVLATIWGWSFLFIKVGVEGLSPLQVATGRVVAGALVLVGVLWAQGARLPQSAAVWGHLTVTAVAGSVIPFFLFPWGEEHITSSRAGVLNATTPLATLLVAMAALPEERPTPARVAGLITGFAGVVIVVAPWSGGGGNPIGRQLACLLAAACYGVAFIYVRRFLTPRQLAPLTLAAGQLVAASALLILLVPVSAQHPMHLNARVVLSVLCLGAAGTGIAYVLMHRLIRDAGATTASMVTYLSPVVAVIVGALVLGEHIGWNLFGGAVVVVAGVALAEGRLHLPQLAGAGRGPDLSPSGPPLSPPPPVPAPEPPPG
jgi:drug/metabolite transporter (DMT)-like permease